MPITINGSGTVTGISAGGLPDGVITTDDIAANAVTFAKIGTTEQGQLCKAWVNFNGTGTVAIRASYNVSSITDNGTGDYTVNFANAFANVNYSVACSTNSSTGDSSRPVVAVDHDNNPINCTIRTAGTFNNNTLVDCLVVNVAIFR